MSEPTSRKEFLKTVSAGSLAGWAGVTIPGPALASRGGSESTSGSARGAQQVIEPNMIGAYGPWADRMHGDEPGALSFRNGRWTRLEDWKRVAQARYSELLARPETGGTPRVTVHETLRYDGLHIERLTWQLPYGPPTHAWFLKPDGATGSLPGVLALHSHGGNKYFGKRKIAQTSGDQHPMLGPFQENYYGGRSWANAMAKRGYAVLVPDAFAFESRRVRVADVPDRIRGVGRDVTREEREEDIVAYNRWAGNHEHILSKSLFCAGTTWPGVFVAEDQRALDVLASRSDVDESRLGCCGLSGGGLRSVMLGGLDPRIEAAASVCMMTTWRDFLLYHSFTHTWMIYIPHLAREMDYSEIFSLQAPKPRFVLSCEEDGIFDYHEQQRAHGILREVYEKAGAPSQLRTQFYPGGHKFDQPMQEDVFDWFDAQFG